MKSKGLLSLGVFLGLLVSAQGQDVGYLSLTQTIPLAHVKGGFNHMSVDAERQLLFATAPTNKTLEIVDLKSGKSLRSLDGEAPAAVRFAPEFNQLYVTRGQSVYIYDGTTFNVVTKVDLQCSLDELQYDPAAETALRRLHDHRQDGHQNCEHSRRKIPGGNQTKLEKVLPSIRQ